MDNTKLTQEDIAKLKQFHHHHFPNQPIPHLSSEKTDGIYQSQQVQHEDEDLGTYENGVTRTLTDDQIAMFRNSEIQRLLQQRRRQLEHEHDEEARLEQRQARKAQQSQSRDIHSRHEVTQPTHFDNDEVVHGRDDVGSLMYDDNDSALAPATSSTKRVSTNEKTFLWPKLG